MFGEMEGSSVSTAVPIRAISGIFAIAGFSIALIAGIAAGNSATRVLLTGVVSLIVCQVVGVLAGAVLDRVVREHLASKGPMPKSSTSAEIVSSAS
jgi:tetrahydromethanopterin S-methyltransferase subunit C